MGPPPMTRALSFSVTSICSTPSSTHARGSTRAKALSGPGMEKTPRDTKDRGTLTFSQKAPSPTYSLFLQLSPLPWRHSSQTPHSP